MNAHDRRQGVTRRGLLTAAAFGALASGLGACGARPSTLPTVADAAPGVTFDAEAAEPPPTESDSPDAPAATEEIAASGRAGSDTAATRPTREQVIAHYAGEHPAKFGMHTPGIALRLSTPGNLVALTFDACGGKPGHPGTRYDAALIDLFRKEGARATLFLSSSWIAANRGPAKELAQDPAFELAAHGLLHRPLSVTGAAAYNIPGTRDPGEVWDEVARNADDIADLTGVYPRWFRSGTAHCDDVAVRICADLGCAVVNFTVDGDAGATLPPTGVQAALHTAKAGDIVISHMNHPGGGDLDGYRRALPALRDRGLSTVTLGEALTS